MMVRLSGELAARLSRASFSYALGNEIAPESVIPKFCLDQKCQKVLGPLAIHYSAHKAVGPITDESCQQIMQAGINYCAEECIGLENKPRDAYERMLNTPVSPPRPVRDPGLFNTEG